jgi:hypothetical protein
VLESNAVQRLPWRCRYPRGKGKPFIEGELFMIYPPGQAKSGEYLMQLWREYLEQYAEKDGDAEGQSIIAAYQTVRVLTTFSIILDRENQYSELINQRISLFIEGSRQAEKFEDCLINSTFSIYNCLNTLCHQFIEGNAEAFSLIRTIDDQVRQSVESSGQIARSAAALRACFPLISLITIAADQYEALTSAIRHVEQRFASGAKAATSDWEHLLNALYRLVEMIQLFALATDGDLKDQVYQLASRFTEEDQPKDLRLKMRNGFCRLFELGHLLATQIDAMV